MADAQHLAGELQRVCHRYHALLLNMDEQTLSVAVSGEASAEMMAALRFAGNRQILLEQWPQARMEQQLKTGAEKPW